MSKTILTKEQELDIINKYNSGISKNKLSKEYSVSESTIRRALVRNNIHIRSIQETNISKYTIDDSFFEVNNQSENSAYICGLLASDGTVSSKENQISIELKADDEELLLQINKIINNSRPINHRIRTDKNPTSRLYFYSKKIKEDLSNYDIIPGKTYEDCDFTKNIDKKYFADFIRGFQDGDGCITVANGGIRWQLDGVSLRTFLSIQSYFKENYDIDLKIVESSDQRSTITKYRIYTYSQKNCKKIFEVLYKEDFCLKMKRKYDKFLSLLK